MPALPEWLDWSFPLYIFAGLFIVSILTGCYFTIHTKQAGIVERFGKFLRIAPEGLNFKLPLIDKVVYREDLNMQLLDVGVTSKTKDDATLNIPVRVQYSILPQKIKEAYYELDDPEDQINAHVENVILSYIPTITLDQAYEQEEQIAKRIQDKLTVAMSEFGYSIKNALVTKIVPSPEVLNAMNNINTQRRNAEAAKAQAETQKTLLVGKAEGEKQAQILAGEGVAGEQKAIVNGLKESLKNFEEGTGVTANSAMVLIMMARYFDALKEMGVESNTIMVPHSPSVVTDLFGQMRSSIISANLVSEVKK